MDNVVCITIILILLGQYDKQPLQQCAAHMQCPNHIRTHAAHMQVVYMCSMCAICISAAHIVTAHEQHANIWTPSPLHLFIFVRVAITIIQDNNMFNCTGQQYDIYRATK